MVDFVLQEIKLDLVTPQQIIILIGVFSVGKINLLFAELPAIFALQIISHGLKPRQQIINFLQIS